MKSEHLTSSCQSLPSSLSLLNGWLHISFLLQRRVMACVFWIFVISVSATYGISFTGDVEADFAGPGTVIVADGVAPDVGVPVPTFPIGTISGWDIKDIRFVYDSNANSLAVGINFFGIAGDADGNGDPSNTSAALSSSGGTDQPNLSGGEAIQIAFDWNADSTFDIIAGIPLSQSAANFSVAPFVNPQPLPADNSHFGPALLGLSPFVGAVNASAPDFEFLIPNVSSLAGFNPAGFSFQA
ncbi:MAG TPA: hypothetical protein VIT23_17155, partial [Terrimicrobiaceae bacterium]